MRVLELGSLDGGHAVALSRWADEVVGLDAREENLRRCRFIASTFHRPNIKFVHANLESFNLESLGIFDLVFCVGVLYHLPDPHKLLRMLPRVAPDLFLWTHHGGRAAKAYTEKGVKDPLSGMSKTSLWLPREELLQTLSVMYREVEVVDETPIPAGPAITIAARGSCPFARGAQAARTLVSA